MTRPADCSVTELLEAYSAGAISPRDVMADVISRIEASEPHLHALWAFEPERALSEAAASEARWQRGEPVGPLDGIPMTIKENIATEGVPVPLGTAATALAPARRDAPPAARSREAGAIIFAKTTMPDYGMLSSGLSSFHALARNPWNTALNPGGSSAGAAAAGAAGYGPLHIGTDIGGSIRLPAGWCGLVGFKPSFGRIPIDPTYIGRVAGPMTRTVSDTAHLMAVLSLPDDRDPLSLPYQQIAWTNLSTDLRGKRIGLWLDAGIGSDPETEVRAAIETAAKAFADEGAIIEPVAPFLTRTMLDGLDRFWRTRSWSDLSRLEPERRARVLPYILAWAEGGQPLSGADVFHGFSQIEAMRDAALAATAPFDFILSPVSPMPAFRAELASPIHDPERPFEHIGFTVSANMSGQPAVSVNCGYTAGGLPIGLQIIGRRYDDLGVLRMAHAYETLRGPQRPWPTFG